MTKTVKAYAKINLLLSIGDTRPDSKHEVVTVMNEVLGLYDDVTVTLNDRNDITLACDAPEVPCDEKNIAFKAAKMYLERFNLNFGIDIQIKKRIPITGGMGGGSTDAAAVLTALQQLCGHGTLKDLAMLAAKLGSDVPFFLYGERTMLCHGTGELAASCPTFPKGLYGVFVTHGKKESTGRAYSLLDEKYPLYMRNVSNLNAKQKLLSALKSGDIGAIFENMSNDFEYITPHFAEVSSSLYSLGAKKVILCGSGPTVCGFFDTFESAKKCSYKLGYKNFVGEI